jgi:hypothetical protein
MNNIINEGYRLGMLQNLYEIKKALEFVKNLNIKNFMEIGTNQGGTFYCWSKICVEDGLKNWITICIRNLLKKVAGLGFMI